MNRRWILGAVLVLLLGLTGCSLMEDSYVSVTPHHEQNQSTQDGIVSAANYRQLRTALEEMVESGQESGVINVSEYKESALESGLSMAARYIQTIYPIGSFAVSDLSYEIGSNSGKPAVAVNITYNRSRIEIQKIHTVQNMEETVEAFQEALNDHDAGLVLLVENYRDTDFSQLAQDYGEENPASVMEIPLVSVGLYGNGAARVAEFTFTYQNSRENLRQMKSQAAPVFASAALYVSGNGRDSQKYSQLYAFLMERFDYTIETSITPAYSLLCHGVGDSRAFATVYAAMCRRAGLTCMTVTGTHSGEPRTWNIICDSDGIYYHVDLLRCSQEGRFQGLPDAEMNGYVWDYSAYPICGGMAETQPTDGTEETIPEE